MILSSSAFSNYGHIPKRYTCDDYNTNPPLKIIGVPENAQSLALIVEDPDVLTGEPWIHWLVWNMDPKTTSIAEGKLPEGCVEGLNGSSNIGYEGPCPPSGEHRYFFMLYALDLKLNLPRGANKETLMQMINRHILAESKLIGMYKRS